MRDERLKALAKTLLHHSIKLQKGEKVVIKGQAVTKPLILELLEQIYEIGAFPYVELTDDEVNSVLVKGYTREQLEPFVKWKLQKYKDIDAYISIVGAENASELADIPQEQNQLNAELMKSVNQYIMSHTKWVVLNYPTKGLAQKAGMSIRAFEDYLLSVSTINYEKMEQAMLPLKDLMEQTDQIRILGPGTDISFSVKGIPAVCNAGRWNIPDGSVLTAPVLESVNGIITYNTPCTYDGIVFHNVSLTFEEGKIVYATADQTDKLNKILDADEGARFIGEFAIGVNPVINQPMGNTLFDTKIQGSFQFSPGRARQLADNGNRSIIHWDMVSIQRPDYGGGAIYFDDVLIRKDGLFTLKELQQLNPEQLK
jgi:aminopeptidase